MIRLMGYRRRASGLLLPVLLSGAVGTNTGGPVNADADGICFLHDSDTAGIPNLISGSWTNVGTASNGSNVHVRVSWKPVTNGESIDPVGGSRARLRIYAFADPSNPVHSFASGGGNGNNANVPSITLTGPRLVVGGIRRGGSGVPTWASPIDQNAFAQNTSGVLTTAESAGALGSYGGQAVAIGTGNDWAAWAYAINGAPA